MNLELPKCSPFDTDKVIRVIGIDPGINLLGISVFEIDIETNKIALIWANTIKSNRFSKVYTDIAQMNDERYVRLHGYKNFLVDFFNNWQPNMVICEDNYMASYATAYGSLKETVLMIRIAVMDYRDDMSVYLVEPSVVKRTIGVSGKSGDKTLMRKAITELDIILHLEKPLEDLDEHAVDAVAIGYKGVKDLIETN